jgi:hypothetical protein
MLVSKDIENLMMAGRNVSATHCALATVRVMATTALMGQAAGVAAALAVEKGTDLAAVCEHDYGTVQQRLLRDGCFLPNVQNEDPADRAREATVTASSEASFANVGPESAGAHEGLSFWRDQAVPLREELLQRRGQWLALGATTEETLKSVSFCLSNLTNQCQTLDARLMKVKHIWDYAIDPGMELAQGALTIEPGEKQWITWQLPADLQLPSNGYIRLDLLENPNVSWHVAGAVIPGHVSAFEMAPGKMRRYSSGVTLSLRVDPPQQSFGAANVISGHTRPYAGTNLWRSDPTQPLPQFLDLVWDQPQTISQVDLTFPGHLLREYHAYAPFYRDPQCVCDYDIQIDSNGDWQTALQIRDNYQRHRHHALPTVVTTTKLRILVLATNGDRSAAIYEIRVY